LRTPGGPITAAAAASAGSSGSSTSTSTVALTPAPMNSPPSPVRPTAWISVAAPGQQAFGADPTVVQRREQIGAPGDDHPVGFGGQQPDRIGHASGASIARGI